MFWKVFVSALLLPSYLGFNIASAAIKNKVEVLPKPEELREPTQQTQVDQRAVDVSPFLVKEHSSIQGTQKADFRQLAPTTNEHPYLIAHWYYHRPCRDHSYYHYGHYHPEYVHYRHYYHPRYYYHYYYHHYYYHYYYYPRHHYHRHYYNNW